MEASIDEYPTSTLLEVPGKVETSMISKVTAGVHVQSVNGDHAVLGDKKRKFNLFKGFKGRVGNGEVNH